MKLYLTTILVAISTLISAQSFDFELGVGTGQPYLVEHFDQTINIHYNPSTNFMSSVVFRNPDSYFDLNLTFLNVNTRIEGFDWNNNRPILNGQINSLTAFLNLEHIAEKDFLDLGYAFGFGYTSEKISGSNLQQGMEQDNFTSLNLSGILKKSVSPRIDLVLRPMILWTDPYNSLKYSNWNIAGEDLSLLLNIGFSYKLKTLAN